MFENWVYIEQINTIDIFLNIVPCSMYCNEVSTPGRIPVV